MGRVWGVLGGRWEGVGRLASSEGWAWESDL